MKAEETAKAVETTVDPLNAHVLAAQLIDASNGLHEALAELNDVTVNLCAAEVAKNKAIAVTLLDNMDDPKRLGSNEAAREASLRNLNLEVFEKVERLRNDQTYRKGIVAENELKYGTIKMLVRLAGVAAGISIE